MSGDNSVAEDQVDEESEIERLALSVRRLFNRAERAIRRNERFTLTFPTAPVNQLRYAGFHLSRVVEEKDKAFRLDELKKAADHCRRAWFDAFDDIVVRLLDFVRTFQLRNFPEEAIRHYYPEYDSAIEIVIAAQGRLESSSKIQTMGMSRAVALLHDVRRLSCIRKHLLFVQSKLDGISELRRTVDQENRAIRLARQFCMSLATSVAGVVLGTMGVGVALFQRGATFGGYISCGVFALVMTLAIYYTLGRIVFASQWGEIRSIDDIIRMYVTNSRER